MSPFVFCEMIGVRIINNRNTAFGSLEVMLKFGVRFKMRHKYYSFVFIVNKKNPLMNRGFHFKI